MMLKVVEKYERAFESYGRDDHNFFLDLTAGDGVLTFDDWEIVLTDVHCLFEGWQDCGDLDIFSMASKMRDKYNKYWVFGLWGQLAFPNVANDIMKLIDKELHCLFNEYSSNAGRIQLFEGRSSSLTNLCSLMEIDQLEMKTSFAK
ncbi:hypothetical protein Gohar_026976 [Gossypium harknessii]|uniref:Uncharacterized protein n=1 Tax=Gossypium harknessii TaxID=34285 RepID=A0A7J9HUS9_9ROSI|nr:hypothetical protein [Gossypium harknessii]